MPAEITLPPFLAEKLAQAPHRHVVHKALENFSDWFRNSRLPFFPDYTDHGIQHIEQVLATTANLIPDHARPHFSGADAAALILAVLLHDSALHLTDAGVWQLIKDPTAPYRPIASFDQKGWAQTWDDFMFLARRWDDTKLAQVFGSTEPGGLPTASVRDPFAHWQNLTRTDNLLIGEFIRQQHPRLAHEMALHGVPGTAGALLKLDDSLPAEWRDLVGLIARSHGLPLRTCLDYLKNAPDFGEYARREYQGVHAVYLMALLRVADYIQIQGDRTSDRIFSYKKIYSSVSTIEHKVHQSVRNITNTADDPEALSILARPDEVSVFLRLKEWLAGIQQELDGSWAVLGEVYGRHEQLRHLGLTFRRVLSNLDDVPKFAATVPYVPDRIRFDVARAELLKLLIGPLYGDDPSYGVRELMQNSIDAVQEYDQFILDNPQYKDVPRREQEADVVVELGPLDEATGYAIMKISDRGIGMTETTIKDYFLRAGASYRQSFIWKNNFETDSGESKSKISRSGRFGVGALASFLIGDEIHVQTRHVTSLVGYEFKATISSEMLEVKRESSLLCGTIISVLLSEHAYYELTKDLDRVARPSLCDWYCFSQPSVVRNFFIGNKGSVCLPRRYSIQLDDKQGTWRKLPSKMPYDIYWNFVEGPTLTCNGLFVNNTRRLDRQFRAKFNRANGITLESLRYPNVSIIDKDAQFPLNLRRDDLRMEDYPFASELASDFLTEMLAWLFFNGPISVNEISVIDISFHQWLMQGHKGLLVANSQGFGIKLSALLNGFPVRHIVLYQPGVSLIFPSHDTLISRGGNSYPNDEGANLGSIFLDLRTSQRWNHRRRMFYEQSFLSKEAPKEFGRDVFTLGAKATEFVVEDYLEEQDGGWITASINAGNSVDTEVSIISKPKKMGRAKGVRFGGNDYNIFEEYHFPVNTFIESLSEPWLLDEIWLEHFGREWIPFDLKERLAKFPKAAQFFKERYPQVVPDEAWVLLGGKPAN